MRHAFTLPEELLKELKSRAGQLGITPSRLAEVYLARGLRSTEPIVLATDRSRAYAAALTTAGVPPKAQNAPEEDPDWLTDSAPVPHRW